MEKEFTQEMYNHIKENTFNPQICSTCQEIDAVLMNLIANAQLIVEPPRLYEFVKGRADGGDKKARELIETLDKTD